MVLLEKHFVLTGLDFRVRALAPLEHLNLVLLVVLLRVVLRVFMQGLLILLLDHSIMGDSSLQHLLLTETGMSGVLIRLPRIHVRGLRDLHSCVAGSLSG